MAMLEEIGDDEVLDEETTARVAESMAMAEAIERREREKAAENGSAPLADDSALGDDADAPSNPIDSLIDVMPSSSSAHSMS